MQAAERARINKDEPVQLILVVMRERSRLYSEIKRIAETELSIRTQCILSKNIRKPKGFEQFCVNVGLKINAKLGGRNYSLSAGQIDFVTSVPVSMNFIITLISRIIVFALIFIIFIIIFRQ